MAVSKKAIDTTPDQIKKAAESADTNIGRRREHDDIIKTLEDGGIKPTNFAMQVEETSKSVLVADTFKPYREWVTPEPGAGLIRDTPVLIAPTDLFAYPGRGGALVFALDEQGNRIPDTEKKEPPKERPRRKRRRNSGMSGMGMGGMGMAMGGARKKARKSQAEIEAEQKKDTEEAKRELAAKLAGPDTPASKEEQEKADAADKGPAMKEIVKGLRWVALTGTLDHGKMLANYRDALKNPAVAFPHYARLDLERQTRQKDGSWSDWEAVDSKRNYDVIENLPEEDEELTLENVRPENLVDPLPFLKSGLWEKVHIASLVPEEKKKIAPPPAMGGMMGGMSGGASGGAMMQAMMGGGAKGGMMGGGGGMTGRSGYGAMMQSMMGGSGRMMGGGFGGAAGATEDTNFWKSDEKKVMIRALDFTPEPDNDYRYRVRIVVFNPNHSHDDVNHDVDKKATELYGPWSAPTDEVSMPADAAPYAMGTLPANPKSDMKVRFQVIRFDPSEAAGGVTVHATFDASPGEVIGEVRTRDVPVSDGSGKKSKSIDFFTRQIVVDTSGGLMPLPAGMPGAAIQRPALALLLKSDGTVMAHTEADDANNEVRKDIERNYAREIKDSSKERKNAMGSGYGGMMQMMMGGGGASGYGGMLGGGRR
jgi:hypothetical protein